MIEEISLAEKYRPETFDEVVGNEHIIERLEEWVESGRTPNICFSGPAGTGKTVMATAFARELFGDSWRQNFYEKNASDERGIDVVRDQIKPIADQGVANSDNQYKLIFLDEADSLTSESQAALRRVMEDYSDKTRFILSCNYLNQLIDPIQSRCAPFNVEPLSPGQMMTIMKRVADGEGIDIQDENELKRIVKYAEGDARRAINTFQAATKNDELGEGYFQEIHTIADTDSIGEIVKMAMGSEIHEAGEALMKDFLKRGVDTQTLADEFYDVIKDLDIPDDSKYLSYSKLAQTEYRIKQGSMPHVQWRAFLTDLAVVRHLSIEQGIERQLKEEGV